MGGLGYRKEDFYMKEFEYVSKKEYQPIKNEVIELLNLVQDEVRDKFTFRYDFIGSVDRNMVTRQVDGNEGYDFDVNLRVNDEDEEFSASEIKHILMDGFNAHSKKFRYDFSEDSKRVITIKVKDKKNSRILHSCDFAVVYDCEDGRQQFIYFNKNQNTYEWQFQPKGFYQLLEKVEAIKENGLWQEVRDVYLEKKCNNTDPKKKSRSIYAETVNQIYNKYFN